MKKLEKLNSKKVRSLLGSLNKVEFRYCELQMSMARDAQNLIREFELSKTDFCLRMRVPVKKYDSIINGSFAFSMEFLAKIQAARVELGALADAQSRKKEIEATMTDVIKPNR